MAGMVRQAMNAAKKPQRQKASPDEQAAYEQAVSIAMDMIFGNDKTSEALFKFVQEGNPEMIGRATVMIMERIEQMMDVPKPMVIHIVANLVKMLLDSASQAGVDTTQIQKPAMLESMKQVFDMYGVSPEEAEAAIGKISQQGAQQVYQEFSNGSVS